MSLNWKIRLSLDDRPHNPMLFLVVSILLHGIVFLCLEIYWQWMANQALQTKPEAMIPVKLIEVPPNQVAVKPPANAKHIASSNSRAGGSKAGGEARSKLSSAAGASASRSTAFLPSQKPSLTQPTLTPKSTGHRSQSQLSRLPQESPPAPPVTTPPQKLDNQNNSPRRSAATEPKIKPSLSRLLRPNIGPVESETHPPNSDRLALNNRPISPSAAPTASNLAPSFNRLLRPSHSPVAGETVHPPNSDNRPGTRPSAPTAPSKLKPSSSRLLSSDTNPIVRSTHPPNPNRLALNSHPNSRPPVAPTAPKVSSSSSQPRQTTVAPTAPKDSSSSSQPRRTTPNTNRPALNSHSNRSSSAAPTAPKVSSSSNQSPRQSSSLLGGPISLASHDFMGGQGDDSATAARIGSDPQGVDALQDVDLGPYLDGLRREVSQRWHPESPDNSKQTIVSFAVSRTGEVNDLRILQSSGSNSIDQAALQAVRRAAPFNPLPGTYPATSLKIEFKFNINVREQQLELQR